MRDYYNPLCTDEQPTIEDVLDWLSGEHLHPTPLHSKIYQMWWVWSKRGGKSIKFLWWAFDMNESLLRVCLYLLFTIMAGLMVYGFLIANGYLTHF